MRYSMNDHRISHISICSNVFDGEKFISIILSYRGIVFLLAVYVFGRACVHMCVCLFGVSVIFTNIQQFYTNFNFILYCSIPFSSSQSQCSLQHRERNGLWRMNVREVFAPALIAWAHSCPATNDYVSMLVWKRIVGYVRWPSNTCHYCQPSA